MANAVVPRLQGDDMQARFFWYKAADLFLDDNIARVGYEIDGARAFDDVVVYYHRPPADLKGPALADFYQVKFHVAHNDAFTWKALIDPAFIGAEKISLLERLRDAQRKHAPKGEEARFHIIAPWPVDANDELGELLSNVEGELRLDVLFRGGNRSKMGRVRKAWRDRLGLSSDEELRPILQVLRIGRDAPMLGQMRELASVKLQSAGWKPYDSEAISSAYDDLPGKLTQTGEKVFDRSRMEEIGRRERLILGPPLVGREKPLVIGMRSFTRGTEDMANTTDHFHCMLPHFDGRWPNDPSAWERDIVPGLWSFLSGIEMHGRTVHFRVSGAHNSLAFVAGYHWDSKSGVSAYPIQMAGGPQVWEPHPSGGETAVEDCWNREVIPVHEGGNDITLALSIRHLVDEDVVGFVRDCVPSVGRVLHLRVRPGPSSTAVRDGSHALALAQTAATALAEVRRGGARNAITHVFSAAPAGFLFFLGQQARSFGTCVLYEHDLEMVRALPYERSVVLPLNQNR